MIGITERAKRELRKLLLNKSDMPQARLRLISSGQGELGIGLDIEYPGDEIIEYQGSRLLVIEQALASSLGRITLDVDDTPQGPQLVIEEAAS